MLLLLLLVSCFWYCCCVAVADAFAAALVPPAAQTFRNLVPDRLESISKPAATAQVGELLDPDEGGAGTVAGASPVGKKQQVGNKGSKRVDKKGKKGKKARKGD